MARLGFEGISEAAATGLLRGNHGARRPRTESAAWVLLTAVMDSQRGRRKGVPGESLQAGAGGGCGREPSPPHPHTRPLCSWWVSSTILPRPPSPAVPR